MLGEDIRALRKHFGWTQQDLAQRLGCTVATISRWESGATRVSRPYLRALSRLWPEPLQGDRHPWQLSEWRKRRALTRIVAGLQRWARAIDRVEPQAATYLQRIQLLAALMDTWEPFSDQDWEELYRAESGGAEKKSRVEFPAGDWWVNFPSYNPRNGVAGDDTPTPSNA